MRRTAPTALPQGERGFYCTNLGLWQNLAGFGCVAPPLPNPSPARGEGLLLHWSQALAESCRLWVCSSPSPQPLSRRGRGAFTALVSSLGRILQALGM